MIPLRLFCGCILQLAPFAFLCCYPFRSRFRFSREKTALITAILLLGISLAFALTGTYLASILPGGHFLFQIVNIVFMCCLLPCFLWYLYSVNSIWQKKLFVFSYALTSALFVISVCNCICTKIYINTPSDGLPYEKHSILIILVVTAITLPVFLLPLKYLYLPVEDSLNAKESAYLSELSLLLFILLASGLSYIDYSYLLSNPMTLFLFFTLFIMIIVIYAVIFKMHSFAQEKYVSQEKYIQMRRQMELCDAQCRQIHESMESSRRMHHDLRLHMLTLNGFLNDGETDKIRAYLEQYLETAREYEILKFCDNPVVNMLVSSYYILAEGNGINFTIRINIPKELPMQTPDLSVLLGNLLGNAVEAADRAPKTHRTIRLNMICSGKMLVITMDNGFDGNIKQDGERYLSTKPDHSGLGLKSLADIVEKYHGGVEFSHDDMMFHSSAMLRLE